MSTAALKTIKPHLYILNTSVMHTRIRTFAIYVDYPCSVLHNQLPHFPFIIARKHICVNVYASWVSGEFLLRLSVIDPPSAIHYCSLLPSNSSSNHHHCPSHEHNCGVTYSCCVHLRSRWGHCSIDDMVEVGAQWQPHTTVLRWNQCHH